MNKTIYLNRLLILILPLLLNSCVTMSGKSPDEKRQTILDMKTQVLNELYKTKPKVKSQIANAPGYAVFSNANVYALFISIGGGYGVVVNNETGKNTYMNMGEAGVGFGLGAKDFRMIFVFHDAATMNDFIEKGWDFGGQADAAAKASDKGAALGGEISINNVSIYQLTETGLAIQATVKGTKYWKADELN